MNSFFITFWNQGDAAAQFGKNENCLVFKPGLKSLSKILSDLAEGEVGNHIHLDKFNSLENGSEELIVEKVG